MDENQTQEKEVKVARPASRNNEDVRDLSDEDKVRRDWESGAYSYSDLSAKYRYTDEEIRAILGDHDLDEPNGYLRVRGEDE